MKKPQDELKFPGVSERTAKLADLGCLVIYRKPLMEFIELCKQREVPFTKDIYSALVIVGEAELEMYRKEKGL